MYLYSQNKYFFYLQSVVVREKNQDSKSIVFFIVVCTLLCITLAMIVPNVYAQEKNFTIIENKLFKISNGNLILVGSVLNIGKVPAQVLIGYKVTDKISSSVTILKTPLYSTIIYPFEVVPFKLIINSSIGNHLGVSDAKPFILNVRYKLVPKYNNILVLNYSSVPFGDNKSLVGEVKNNSPFNMNNVVLYASAHSKNGTQIDSVKSTRFPIIKAGQTLKFSAFPNQDIKSQIYSYSCVGADLQDAMSYRLVEVGQKQTVGYKLSGLATIDDIKYINSTDSITFRINNYYSTPGPMELMIMPTFSEKQHVSLIMDGKVYKNVVETTSNGKEILINFLIPQGEHQFQVTGISRVHL